MKIGDYLEEDTVDKMVKLMREYQDPFPTKFLDLKGIIGDMGIMKTTFKPDTMPIK